MVIWVCLNSLVRILGYKGTEIHIDEQPYEKNPLLPNSSLDRCFTGCVRPGGFTDCSWAQPNFPAGTPTPDFLPHRPRLGRRRWFPHRSPLPHAWPGAACHGPNDCQPGFRRAAAGGIFPFHPELPAARWRPWSMGSKQNISAGSNSPFSTRIIPQTFDFQRSLGFYSQPELYLLDANGKMLEKWVGYTSQEELETAFTRHLE